MSPVLIGRVGPLSRLAALVAAAEVGSGDEPAVALVSGEPGIGKTRLVTELVSGSSEVVDVPVHGVMLGARPGSDNRPLDVFSSILHDDSKLTAGDQAERTVLEHVQQLCADGPTVVVIDDVHWIDADSAALVDEMARRPWSSLVLVVTYRTGALRRGSPGGELVARLERRAVDHVRLDRLGRNEVGALIEAIIGEQPSSAVVDAVTHRSDGNPFVAEELMRVLPKTASGVERFDAISTVELPWSLGDAVRQQLCCLTDHPRRVIEALAILDDASPFDTLATVAELDADLLVAALRELVTEGVVDEIADDIFELGHALLADAVTQQLLGRERRRLHENALAALTARADATEAADDAALLRHAAGAGKYDQVLDLARSGARKALDGGRSFLALRLAALGLDEEPDDPDLLAVATDAAWRLDFLDEAADAAERWVDMATGIDRVNALHLESRVAFERDDTDRAGAAAARLERIAGDDTEDPHQRAGAAASLAQLYMFAHRMDDAVRWGDQALTEATALGDKLTAARARVERSIALTFSGTTAEHADEIRAAIADAYAVGDKVLTGRGVANLLNIVPASSREGQRLIDELTTLARRTGSDKMAALASTRRCDAALALGDLAAARRALAEVRSSWMNVTSDQWRVEIEALIAIEDGRFDDAERILRPVTDPDTYAAVGIPVNSDPNHVPRLWLALAASSGDHARGQTIYASLAQSSKTWSWQFAELLGVVEAALAVGIEPDQVRADFVTSAPPLGQPGHGDATALAEGLLAFAEGREADAVELLEPRLAGERDERLWANTTALLRITLARSLLALGERARAEAVARHVVEHDLARWPGVRRDRAEELLRRLSTTRMGAHDGIADDGPGAMLTPREREVAVLLSEGLSNGRLAERLYISPKTAAVHVSNILAKLGLSSRAEVAAWAVRHLEPLSPGRDQRSEPR